VRISFCIEKKTRLGTQKEVIKHEQTGEFYQEIALGRSRGASQNVTWVIRTETPKEKSYSKEKASMRNQEKKHYARWKVLKRRHN